KVNDLVSERLDLDEELDEDEDEDEDDDGEDIEFMTTIRDDFNKEAEEKIEEEKLEEQANDDDFTVQIAETSADDEELDENSIDGVAQDLGEYDPKLDLSTYSLPSIDLLTD